MRGKWLFLLFVLFSCTEDEFPNGIYGYQVERLLSGGESKTWLLSGQSVDGAFSTPVICSDSVRLIVTLVEDSISFLQLNPGTDCSQFDTLNLGQASASSRTEGQVFTDSINFSDGSFWILERITSLNFSYTDQRNNFQFISTN